MRPQDLIVVTGPVGGGKSTTSTALGARLRSEGRRTAVVDLDDVYCMARQGEGWGESDAWTSAWRGCGGLASIFLETGIDAVLIDGEFFSADMISELLAPIGSGIRTSFFALLVSYPATLRRVQADESRRGRPSGNPDFLKRLHDQYVRALPFLRENYVCFEADQQPVEHLVQAMLDLLTIRPVVNGASTS